VGDSGLVIHTTDGGENWEQQSTGTFDILWAVCFIDLLNGWTVGQHARIFHTTDGGNNWITQNSEDTLSLLDVHFVNANEGWAVGSKGMILHTSNGGNTWTQQNTTFSNTYHCVYFIDNLYGWIGGYDRVLYRTTDGGQTWISLTNPDPGITYRGIQFTDNLHGWRIGGGIAYTNDGGYTWTNSTNVTGYDIKMLDQSTGFAVGGNTIQKTTNGINWSIVAQIGYANALYAVSFTDEMTGWVVGRYGMILHTTDGGVNWIRQASGSVSRYQVFGGNTWKLISDLELVNDIIEVIIPEKVMQNYSLVNVEFSFDSVLHTSVSDLEFYLEHNGAKDTLIFQSSCNGENFIRTTLSDMAANSISSGTAPYTGIFLPDQPLSRFDGMDPNGQWILGIYDGEIGNTGQFNGWSLTLYFEVAAGIDEQSLENIMDFQLQQNFPNPFNPSTKISWQSPVDGHQTIKVFDVLGNEIATLVDEYKPAGSYQVEFQSSAGNRQLASGIYFYQLKAGEYIQTKKMVLTK
jgi:photosystem II stability/assembly factor-like uncharacterized protein/subtilisin-like proprotein convertase family protein